MLLLSIALAGKVFADLALVNRAPAAPGEILLLHRGDTSPQKVMLRSEEGKTHKARKVGSLAYDYRLHRVPEVPPGRYRVVYIDGGGEERDAGAVEIVEGSSYDVPTLTEVAVTKEDYVYDDGEGGFFPGRHAVARVESNAMGGTWFVEATNRSEPERVPARAALNPEGRAELIVSVARHEPWEVCPTLVIRDGRWNEVARFEEPCLP